MEYIFNETPESVKKQLELITAQLIIDGSSGIMVAMMENKGINLVDRIADCDACIVLENTFASKQGLGKGKVDGANKLTNVVKTHMRGIAQNGKSVLPTMSGLGDYGFDIRDGKRVVIPGSERNVKILVVAVNTKVLSFTTPPCPFNPYLTLKSIVLTDDITNIELAITMKGDAAQLRQDCNGIIHTINVKMEAGEINLRDFAEVITQVSPNDPALAALYGYKTRNTSTVEKPQITKLLPTEFKSLENIAKLTLLVNKTNQDLWVRKGKRRTGAYVILKANSTLLVTYGYGTCTIQNPSTTAPSELSSTVNRKAKAA